MTGQQSLNVIADNLAHQIGKPFDAPTKNNMKQRVGNLRARLMHEFMDKHPHQRRFFLQDFIVPVERVEASECPDILTGCKVIKTVDTVPKPIRSKDAMFDYVGGLAGDDPYGSWDMAWGQYLKFSRYTKSRPRWHYMNDMMYLINETTDRHIRMRGVFENPQAINKCATGTTCITDDDEYPIPRDLLNIIETIILKSELGTQVEEEVLVDKETDGGTDRKS